MANRIKWQIRGKSLFAYLMVGSFVCLLLPSRLTNKLDHLCTSLIAPFSKSSRDLTLVVSAPLRHGAEQQVSAKDYQDLQQEYHLAQNRLVNVSQELRYQKEQAQQLAGLRQQLSMEQVNFLSAHITGSDTGNVSHVKILDQGSMQQVSAGQIALGVVHSEGADGDGDSGDSVPDIYQMAVVGRIIDTALGTSRLQLITDARFQVPVEIRPRWNRQQNWRVKGIMKGRGTWDMTVELVSANYPVMAGDPVLIRAGTDTLPETMLIGFVHQCKRDDKNAVLWQVEVEPAVDLNNLRKVIIAAHK